MRAGPWIILVSPLLPVWIRCRRILVVTETGRVAVEIYDTDSPMTRKIKEFMALYGIVDIKMRMLRIPELKKIMGFPEDYMLIGTQADQKKIHRERC